jgi:hypothetical protein
VVFTVSLVGIVANLIAIVVLWRQGSQVWILLCLFKLNFESKLFLENNLKKEDLL